MHYFMIYALFFLLRLVSACMDFDCRFTLSEPSIRRKDVKLTPNEFKRASKRGPTAPRLLVQGKNWGSRRHPKVPHSGERGRSRAVVTTVQPWWLPRRFSPMCFDFLRSILVSTRFSPFCAVNSSLKLYIWLQRWVDSKTKHPHKLIQTPWETTIEQGERRRRRRGIRRKQRFGGELRDRHSSTTISFLFSYFCFQFIFASNLFLLPISSFLVRAFVMFNLLVSIMCEDNFLV